MNYEHKISTLMIIFLTVTLSAANENRPIPLGTVLLNKYYFYCDSTVNRPLFDYVKTENRQASLFFGDRVMSHNRLDSMMNSGNITSAELHLMNYSYFKSKRFRIDGDTFVSDSINSFVFRDIRYLVLNRRMKLGNFIGYPIRGFVAGAMMPLIYETIRYPFYKNFKWGPTICFGCAGSLYGLIEALYPKDEKIYFHYPAFDSLR